MPLGKQRKEKSHETFRTFLASSLSHIVDYSSISAFVLISLSTLILLAIDPGLLPFRYEDAASIFAAALGALSTIFALFLGSLLLLYQQIATNAPTMIDLFPQNRVVILVAGLVVALLMDGLAMVVAPALDENRTVTIYYAILAYNGSMVVLVGVWVGRLVSWMKPDTLIQKVITSAAGDPSRDRLLKLVRALDEQTASAMDRGFLNLMIKYARVYGALADKVKWSAAHWQDEESGNDPFLLCVHSLALRTEQAFDRHLDQPTISYFGRTFRQLFDSAPVHIAYGHLNPTVIRIMLRAQALGQAQKAYFFLRDVAPYSPRLALSEADLEKRLALWFAVINEPNLRPLHKNVLLDMGANLKRIEKLHQQGNHAIAQSYLPPLGRWLNAELNQISVSLSAGDFHGRDCEKHLDPVRTVLKMLKNYEGLVPALGTQMEELVSSYRRLIATLRKAGLCLDSEWELGAPDPRPGNGGAPC